MIWGFLIETIKRQETGDRKQKTRYENSYAMSVFRQLVQNFKCVIIMHTIDTVLKIKASWRSLRLCERNIKRFELCCNSHHMAKL